MSFLMRQGQPANDVALYLPNSDGWASFTAGKVHMIETLREHLGTDIMPAILEAGYNLDFFDDDALDRVGRVEKGALVLGPNRYHIVVLPGVERIPPNTLSKLEAFARGGGVLVATRRIPNFAPGLQSTEAEQSQIRELSRTLFESPSAPAHFVTEEKQLGPKMKSLSQPDVELSPSVPEIGFIHRRSNEAEIYFLANTSNLPHSVKATFRVQGLQPESWDPITGRVWAAKVEARPNGGTTVALSLAPYESRVIVFSKRAISAPSA